MKMLWCWRCEEVVPMLDEDEFTQVMAIYAKTMQAIMDRRQATGSGLAEIPIHDYFAPFRSLYEQLTGYVEMHEDLIFHHRLSTYGDPCVRCGKPLRTPKAKLCGSCMWPRGETQPTSIQNRTAAFVRSATE